MDYNINRDIVSLIHVRFLNEEANKMLLVSFFMSTYLIYFNLRGKNMPARQYTRRNVNTAAAPAWLGSSRQNSPSSYTPNPMRGRMNNMSFAQQKSNYGKKIVSTYRGH